MKAKEAKWRYLTSHTAWQPQLEPQLTAFGAYVSEGGLSPFDFQWIAKVTDVKPKYDRTSAIECAEGW